MRSITRSHTALAFAALAATGAFAASASAQCVPANNIEAVIDDSGSMSFSDPNELRSSGLELFIRTPQNASKVLGAVEFGSAPATSVFKPALISTGGASMIAALRAATAADNGGTDYDSGFIQGFLENPVAKARIFLTDGANNGDFTNTHLLSFPSGSKPPPVYVVGLGIGKPGTGEDANRLQAIAQQTGGRYFPDVQQAAAQAVFNSISSLVNCQALPKTFTSKIFVTKGQKQSRGFPVSSSTKRFGLVLNWAVPTNKFTFAAIKAIGKKNKVLATLSGKGKPRKLKVKKLGSTTFLALDFKKPSGTRKLRITIRASTLNSSELTVTQLSGRP
jgi:hypothetical protein